MGRSEKIILWISVTIGIVIAIVALAISLHNFGRINQNEKVINIVAETQEYIIEWIK
ncbi:hypothetical protein ES705_15737 [subsurface metagenome]|nr:hypothetical protein [Clostridia bacterium]